MTPDGLKESLDLCEDENSRLRKILLWCAERLPKTAVPELRRMIKREIVVTQAEENREMLLSLIATVEKLVGHIEAGCEMPHEPHPPWWAKTAALAATLNGLLQEIELPPSLHEVRDGRHP